jgi:hypothetical protein
MQIIVSVAVVGFDVVQSKCFDLTDGDIHGVKNIGDYIFEQREKMQRYTKAASLLIKSQGAEEQYNWRALDETSPHWEVRIRYSNGSSHEYKEAQFQNRSEINSGWWLGTLILPENFLAIQRI